MGKRDLSANNAQFVSVDLIGEKNQVILEFSLLHTVINIQIELIARLNMKFVQMCLFIYGFRFLVLVFLLNIFICEKPYIHCVHEYHIYLSSQTLIPKYSFNVRFYLKY